MFDLMGNSALSQNLPQQTHRVRSVTLLVKQSIHQHNAELELLLAPMIGLRNGGLHLGPDVLGSAWVWLRLVMIVLHCSPSLFDESAMSHNAIMTPGTVAFHPAKDLNPLAHV
jgi:hypothetical protein